jgi:hypothetical protein
LGRWIAWAAIGAGSVSLAVTLSFLVWEASWARDANFNGQDAFLHGSIGTELAPLAVVKVLPKLAPTAVLPAGKTAGDMIDQFGFIRRAPNSPYPALPFGLTVSYHRPLSGAPSPIPFVGIGCSTCHSAAPHLEDEAPRTIIGAGNAGLDILAWGNALEAALLAKDEGGEPLLTVRRIVEASTESIPYFPDRVVIYLWLRQARKTAESTAQIYDDNEPGTGLRNADKAPVGPGRTTPFRSLVRKQISRPEHDPAYSKIPVVFHQAWKPWAQFDGSVKSPTLRSAVAAMTITASRENLTDREIGRNVTRAASYVMGLGGPRFAEWYPNYAPKPTDPAVVRGRDVYGKYCGDCHGRPTEDSGWDGTAPRFGRIIPLEEIGTDPWRTTFRHADELSAKIIKYTSIFPKLHPFAANNENLRLAPGNPESSVRGYLAGPLDSLFSRAPFLHNASILSMSELINLEPRHETFCRGTAIYDPERLGLAFVAPGASGCALESKNYFLFDTRRPGNAANGHNYPWAYGDSARNEGALRDLLAYLKTF